MQSETVATQDNDDEWAAFSSVPPVSHAPVSTTTDIFQLPVTINNKTELNIGAKVISKPETTAYVKKKDPDLIRDAANDLEDINDDDSDFSDFAVMPSSLYADNISSDWSFKDNVSQGFDDGKASCSDSTGVLDISKSDTDNSGKQQTTLSSSDFGSTVTGAKATIDWTSDLSATISTTASATETSDVDSKTEIQWEGFDSPKKEENRAETVPAGNSTNLPASTDFFASSFEHKTSQGYGKTAEQAFQPPPFSPGVDEDEDWCDFGEPPPFPPDEESTENKTETSSHSATRANESDSTNTGSFKTVDTNCPNTNVPSTLGVTKSAIDWNDPGAVMDESAENADTAWSSPSSPAFSPPPLTESDFSPVKSSHGHLREDMFHFQSESKAPAQNEAIEVKDSAIDSKVSSLIV